MSRLPPELITDVLSRVSATDLLRFRCVSKRFRRLIDGHDFINMHLRRFSETNANQSLLLRRNSHLFAVDLSLNGPDLSAAELDHPVMGYSDRLKILGAANGLLCLRNVAGDTAVWNPSTRRHVFVPHLDLHRPDSAPCPFHMRSFGFGYESANDDFKLVRLVQFFGQDRARVECQVMVYSMNRSFWKRIDDMPFLCYSQEPAVFASGALHWICTTQDRLETGTLIVALDLATYTYKNIPLPDNNNNNNNDQFDFDIGVLGGCLCVIVNFQRSRVDLWVMRRYGAGDSWSRVFSTNEALVTRAYECVKPLGYSGDWRRVLLGDKYSLLWYDLEGKGVERVCIRDMPVSFEALVMPQTLVPLQSNRRSEEMRKGRNKRRDDFLSQGFKLVL